MCWVCPRVIACLSEKHDAQSFSRKTIGIQRPPARRLRRRRQYSLFLMRKTIGAPEQEVYLTRSLRKPWFGGGAPWCIPQRLGRASTLFWRTRLGGELRPTACEKDRQGPFDGARYPNSINLSGLGSSRVERITVYMVN